MTMTVKLDPRLEHRLREHSARSGRSASDVIREALSRYLGEPAPHETSAYALGADLFGRHAGAADLATTRKALILEAWAGKRVADGR